MDCKAVGKPPVFRGSKIPLSPAYRVGNLLFLSGQLALNTESELVGETIEQQTEQCFNNIGRILALAGAGFKDIVKCTVWLSRAEDFAAFNTSYAKHFSSDPPARSTVRSDLLIPGALVEIEAVATVP